MKKPLKQIRDKYLKLYKPFKFQANPFLGLYCNSSYRICFEDD